MPSTIAVLVVYDTGNARSAKPFPGLVPSAADPTFVPSNET